MEFDLLAGLGEADRRAVLAVAVRRRYKRGDIIFHADDPGDSFHLLAKGRVAIRVGTPAGDVATLTVLGVGQGFGEQALLSVESRRSATAVALEPAETLRLGHADFDELRARQPTVERLLLDHVAGQVRRLSEQLVEALYLPAEKRVLRRLLELDELYDGGEIALTQDDLASMAGTTRPTANRVLQGVVADGLVAVARGKLDVVDRGALAQRAR
ncbi:MAG: Crp/Fnr family transcriptional regulator [Acidimicrobiia bacterium]|nr:Crp/Fnr family transcriptional regulator [Acidimicrobiia bacterium]